MHHAVAEVTLLNIRLFFFQYKIIYGNIIYVYFYLND